MRLWQAHQFSEMDWHDLGWAGRLWQWGKEQTNIFTTWTNHRDNLFPFKFVSVSPPNYSFVCHIQFSILVNRFREENVGEYRCNIVITQTLTDESLLSQIQFCRNLATEDWSGGGEAETIKGSIDPLGVIFFNYLFFFFLKICSVYIYIEALSCPQTTCQIF